MHIYSSATPNRTFEFSGFFLAVIVFFSKKEAIYWEPLLARLLVSSQTGAGLAQNSHGCSAEAPPCHTARRQDTIPLSPLGDVTGAAESGHFLPALLRRDDSSNWSGSCVLPCSWRPSRSQVSEVPNLARAANGGRACHALIYALVTGRSPISRYGSGGRRCSVSAPDVWRPRGRLIAARHLLPTNLSTCQYNACVCVAGFSPVEGAGRSSSRL